VSADLLPLRPIQNQTAPATSTTAIAGYTSFRIGAQYGRDHGEGDAKELIVRLRGSG
jgi:hypothetical protein